MLWLVQVTNLEQTFGDDVEGLHHHLTTDNRLTICVEGLCHP